MLRALRLQPGNAAGRPRAALRKSRLLWTSRIVQGNPRIAAALRMR